MVRTASTMLDLGTQAPDFSLADVVTGKTISLATFTEKKALLVMFICRHCPYVKHVQNELAKLAKDYQDSALGIVAISSNDAETYPDDSPESLKEMANELGFDFPYCYDEDQSVAKSYAAACTPDFYLFDENRELVYRGQLDDSRPKSDIPITGKDLRAAIEAALNGKEVDQNQRASLGCNIKWKEGNEPTYFSGL
ncbi:MAG: thioredoxin family protein [Acidobacteria bacterium]|nr:thioredoxin family protein [Acidobacteriota bacterium]